MVISGTAAMDVITELDEKNSLFAALRIIAE